MLRKSIIRLVLPIAWRWSPRRKAAALAEFARTEFDSAWQSLHAMQHVADPELRARLFQHALEEVEHAARFECLHRRYSGTPPSSAPFERQSLFETARASRAALDFFAYEHLGERDISGEFLAYAAAAPDADIAATFRAIEREELGHVQYTRSMVDRLASDTSLRRRALTRARWRRFQEAWLRFGHTIGAVPITILLTVAYFAFGPLVAGRCRGLVRAGRTA